MKSKNLFLITILGLFGSLMHWPANSEESPRYEHDVYAFMPHFVLDLERGWFLNGIRGLNYPVTNCGDEDAVCIFSNVFKLEMPRSCERRSAWLKGLRDGGVTVEKRRHLRNETLHLVADPKYPDYGFLVGKNGLVGVIYSPIQPVLEIADRASLQKALAGEKVEFSYGELLSAVRLGKCHKQSRL